MAQLPIGAISVRFMNVVEDHLEAQRLLYSKTFFAKGDKVAAAVLVCVGIVMISLVGFRWWTVILFPLAVVEWFNLLNLGKVRTRVEFKRNPKFREEYNIIFSPESIHFKTATIDSELKWTHYERVVEGAGIFLLMYGKGFYTLIPKRCFRSDAETNAFRDLLRQSIR